MHRCSRPIILAAALALVCSNSVASAQALTAVSIGVVSATAGEWPTFVAQDLGFFKRYGLDPSIIVAGSAAATVQQALAGSVDIAETSPTQIVESVQNGAPIRYFCDRMASAPYAMLAQKQYKRYSDLKGKTIMIGGPSDITVIFTEKMLASGGLKMSDVDFTYAGGTTERFAALENGGVAAAILFPPFDSRAAEAGFSVLGTLVDVLPQFPFIGWAATDKYAQSHADLLVRFTKGYLRGVRWLNDPRNRVRAIDILVKDTKTAQPDAEKSYDTFVAKNKLFSPRAITVPKSFQTVIDALVQIKVVSPPIQPATSYFDNRYAQQAEAQLAREPS